MWGNMLHQLTSVTALVTAAGVSTFMACAGFVEYRIKKLRTEPISSGLMGKFHHVLDAGFIGMCFALAVIGVRLENAVSLLCFFSGIGVFGAMATDSWGLGGKHRRAWHLNFAKMAYGGALPLLPLLAWQAHNSLLLYALAALYPFSVLLAWIKDRKDTEFIEKTATGAICVFLLAYCAYLFIHSGLLPLIA